MRLGRTLTEAAAKKIQLQILARCSRRLPDEAQHQHCFRLCSLLRDDCSPLYDHVPTSESNSEDWSVRKNRFGNNTSEPLSPAPRLSEKTDLETIPQSPYPLHPETPPPKKKNKNESPTVKPLTIAINFWLLPTILQEYRLQEECQIAFEERFYERPKGRTTIKDSMKQNVEEV